MYLLFFRFIEKRTVKRILNCFYTANNFKNGDIVEYGVDLLFKTFLWEMRNPPKGPCWPSTSLFSAGSVVCKYETITTRLHIKYNCYISSYVLLCFIDGDWHSIATDLSHFINETYTFAIYRLNRLIYNIARWQQFLHCCTSNFNKPTCTRQGMKRHSPTTNLRIRYCKMVAKSESWSELSSDRDRESLSSILLEVEVPIQMKIFNTSYNVKALMEYTLQ